MFFKGCVRKACYTYGTGASFPHFCIYPPGTGTRSLATWLKHHESLWALASRGDSALRALSFVLLPSSGDLHWKLHGKMVQLLRPGRLRAVCEIPKIMQGERYLDIWDFWDTVFAPTHGIWRCWK